MHLGAIVVDLLPPVRAEGEHRGAGRQSDFCQVDARKEDSLHVHDRLVAGPYGETVGTRNRGAVQQCMYNDGIGVALWLLHPEGAEERKLLALRIGGLQCEPARGKTVDLIAAERAEVTRAEKDRDLIEFFRAVDVTEQANARKSEIVRRHRLGDELADVEITGRVG